MFEKIIEGMLALYLDLGQKNGIFFLFYKRGRP